MKYLFLITVLIFAACTPEPVAPKEEPKNKYLFVFEYEFTDPEPITVSINTGTGWQPVKTITARPEGIDSVLLELPKNAQVRASAGINYTPIIIAK